MKAKITLMQFINIYLQVKVTSKFHSINSEDGRRIVWHISLLYLFE